MPSELIDIIEWTDDSRDTLSYRFPDDDRAIERGAQLIVRGSQAAQFVYLGRYGDTFGPGKHRLTTDNIPVLNRIKGWKYGFESPFKADVNPALMEKYGVEMASVVVENVSVPPEVEEAIDKRASMSAVESLNDYVKYQMAKGFE